MSTRKPRSELERRIEDDFVAGMLRCGYMSIKGDSLAEMYFGRSDRLFFGHGPRTVVVEFKREDAKPGRRGEKLQDHIRAEFRKRGYEVYKVIGRMEAQALFRKINGEEM